MIGLSTSHQDTLVFPPGKYQITKHRMYGSVGHSPLSSFTPAEGLNLKMESTGSKLDNELITIFIDPPPSSNNWQWPWRMQSRRTRASPSPYLFIGELPHLTRPSLEHVSPNLSHVVQHGILAYRRCLSYTMVNSLRLFFPIIL